MNFEQQHLTDKILEEFGMKSKKNDFKDWKKLIERITRINSAKNEVNIAVVGKILRNRRVQIGRCYISVVEAIKHGSWANNVKANLHWISSIDVEKQGAKKVLGGFDGIVVPGGFGTRGTEGMIQTGPVCAGNNIPYLGLC